MTATKRRPNPDREAFVNLDDRDLQAELMELRRELDAHRSTGFKTRDRAHRFLDEHVEQAQRLLEVQIRRVRWASSQAGGELLGVEFTPTCLALNDPDIVRRMHSAIDDDTRPGEADPGWSGLSEDEYQAEAQRLRAAVAEREVELEARDFRRDVIAKQREHRQRLAAIADQGKTA